MGIWPDGYDNTDINALDRSDATADAPGLAGGHVVAADDFGNVLLFNHPCVQDDAPFHQYRGHSSHVTGVRFLKGSQRCVSIGGHDRAVFQWAVW
jgi:microtubule-associated protein-like 6